MRAVVQRVRSARVLVGDEVVGAVGQGLLVLLGVAPTDTLAQVQWLADKIVGLRIFAELETPGSKCRSRYGRNRRRRLAIGQSVHPLRRLPQGPSAQFRR